LSAQIKPGSVSILSEFFLWSAVPAKVFTHLPAVAPACASAGRDGADYADEFTDKIADKKNGKHFCLPFFYLEFGFFYLEFR
jgi:hypothetical protein